MGVVPIPRLYLEYKWNKLVGASGERYKDIRRHEQITVSQFANGLFVFVIIILIEDRFNIVGLRAVLKPFLDLFGH
jgi:hypothetical protein